jgi:hypothetical protein
MRMNSMKKAPNVFISYSWESDEHKKWVHGLAIVLRNLGIAVTLDHQWHTAPRDRLPKLMRKVVQWHDFVLVVCTPHYKQKSENRAGGDDYEGDVITTQVFTHGNIWKFHRLKFRRS